MSSSSEAALIVMARRPSVRFTFAGEWEDDTLSVSFARAVAMLGTAQSSSAHQ